MRRKQYLCDGKQPVPYSSYHRRHDEPISPISLRGHWRRLLWPRRVLRISAILGLWLSVYLLLRRVVGVAGYGFAGCSGKGEIYLFLSEVLGGQEGNFAFLG